MAGPIALRDRWIDWVLRQHRTILVVALLLTAVAGWLASHLKVNSDLRRLLPSDHAVVQSLEEIERTFGSTGSVNVVVSGSDAEARHAFSTALAVQLEGHPLLKAVDYQLPSGFFAEHALFYLSDAEMNRLGDLIDEWLLYEAARRAPDSFLSKPDPRAPDNLERFVEAKRTEAQERTGFDEFYEREGIDANVLLLRPNQPAASLVFAQEVSTQMKQVAREVFAREGAAWSGTGIHYNMVGPYINKADEHAIIRRDTLRAGVVAVVGVILVLFFLFRSQRAVLILLAPLSCGVIWSLAGTYLLIGDLNVMTSMISTVVMGAGIDAGIHFYVRARQERREHDNNEAIRRTFRGLIVPLLIASSTTVGAFGVMGTSAFPAFREFGIISAMGVALCLAAMVTVLPALACLVGIKRSVRPPRRTEGWLSHALLAKPPVVLATLVAVSLIALLGARQLEFEYNGRALQSDHSREAAAEDTAKISKIFRKDIHAGILIRHSLEDARDVLVKARAAREALLAAGKTSVVAELFAAPDLLPDVAIDPQARLKKIRGLLDRETIKVLERVAGVQSTLKPSVGKDWVDEDDEDDWDEDEDEPADEPAKDGPNEPAKDGAQASDGDPTPAVPAADGASASPTKPNEAENRLSQDDARALLQMLEAEPFTVDDLPAALLHAVRTEEGAYGIFAYPDFDAADMRKGVEFTTETSAYLGGGELFVGETTVYAAMFLMMREEAPYILSLAALLIAVLVYWQLRSLRAALMTLLPLGLALWWLIGIMGAIDLRFTLFNLPILPAILGIGVDNGVYLTDRIRRSKGQADGLRRSLQEAGAAIMAAMATTAIGFAAFMVADSAGVRGIGAVAVLGIVLAGFAATLVLPTLSGISEGRRRRKLAAGDDLGKTS